MKRKTLLHSVVYQVYFLCNLKYAELKKCLFINQAMPTFQVYKGGSKVVELVGADKGKLAQAVANFK